MCSLNKITVYGWAMIVAAAMLLIKIDGKRLMDIKTAPARGVYWDTIFLVATATTVGFRINCGRNWNQCNV